MLIFFFFLRVINFGHDATSNINIQMESSTLNIKCIQLSSQQLERANQNKLEAQVICLLVKARISEDIKNANMLTKIEIRNGYVLFYQHPENKFIGGFTCSFKQSFELVYPKEGLLQGKISSPEALKFYQISDKEQKEKGKLSKKKFLVELKQLILQLRKIQSHQDKFDSFISILQKNTLLQKGFHHFFTAKRRIGQSLSAVTFQAIDKRNNVNVAVKVFRAIKTYDLKRQIEKEFSILSSLKHPNICQLYGLYEYQNRIYAVLQLQKYTLGYFIKQKLSSSKRIKKIMKDLLTALDYMHKRGLMHRDLKQQNIQIKSDINGDIKAIIIDFGLAEYIHQQNFSFLKCGTPGYIAPQIFTCNESIKYNEKCDIFSLGCIFYFLLAKKHLFGQNPAKIKQLNRICQIVIKDKISEEIGNEQLELLRLLLQKDSNKRISAQEALKLKYFDDEKQKNTKQQKTQNSIPKI